jgi:hypothetical protein
VTLQQDQYTTTTCSGIIPSERPGVYISNADAIVLAADLRKLLGPDPSDSRKEAVRWFVELLERVK